MAYRNYSVAGRGGFSRQPYYNSGYRFNSREDYRDESEGNWKYSRGGGRQARKHTGAKTGMGKNGKPYVSGWNYSRTAGMVTYFAHPYKGTKRKNSKPGRTWENWILKVFSKRTMQEFIKPCLFEPATGKVICGDLSLVMNPKTNFCGRNYRKN